MDPICQSRRTEGLNDNDGEYIQALIKICHRSWQGLMTSEERGMIFTPAGCFQYGDMKEALNGSRSYTRVSQIESLGLS